MRHEVGRLLGQAHARQVAREQPGDPADDAGREQRGRDDGARAPDGGGRRDALASRDRRALARPADRHAAGRPAGAVGAPGAGAAGDAMGPEASSRVKRVQAPFQPSGVSGHHSMDGGRGAPAGQIP